MIKALDNRFYVKFMQLEIGLLDGLDIHVIKLILSTVELNTKDIKLNIHGRKLINPFERWCPSFGPRSQEIRKLEITYFGRK